MRTRGIPSPVTPRQRILGLLAFACALGLAGLEIVRPGGAADGRPGALVVEIADDGALTLAQDRQVVALGRLGVLDSSESADALDALRGELRTRTREPALRDERGRSTLVLRIVTGPTVSWAFVHGIVRVAGDPNVELVDLRFALRGDPAEDIGWQRPTGESCCPGPYVQATSPFVRLVVGGPPDAGEDGATVSLRVWFGTQTTSSHGQGAERIEAETVTEHATFGSLGAFRSWWDLHREAMHGGAAQLEVTGSSRRPLASGDVVVVWRALRRAQVRRVTYAAVFALPAARPR